MKVPHGVVAMGHGHPLIVRDHVIVYRLNRLRVRLHPADLEHQSPDRVLNGGKGRLADGRMLVGEGGMRGETSRERKSR